MAYAEDWNPYQGVQQALSVTAQWPMQKYGVKMSCSRIKHAHGASRWADTQMQSSCWTPYVLRDQSTLCFLGNETFDNTLSCML